tara:strand:+ start:22692 stop:25883 length:3192 start_codon:yes stop_codon:yes gene_type:complete
MLVSQKELTLGDAIGNPLGVQNFYFNKTSETTQQIAIDEPLSQTASIVRVIDPDGDTIYYSINPRYLDRYQIMGDEPVTSSVIRHTIDLPTKTGIYRVVIKGTDGSTWDILADFSIDQYGIQYAGGILNEDCIDFSPGYIFVPAEAPDYGFLFTGDVTIAQSDDTPIDDTEHPTDGTVERADNPTFGSDDVWTLTTSGSWTLRFERLPFVVCNSLAAANAIQSGTTKPGSIRFWGKGDELGHSRIVEIIATMSSTDYEDSKKTWPDAATEWAANPRRYYHIDKYANCFRTVHTALNQQNFTTSAHRCGHVHDEIGSTGTGMLPYGAQHINRGGFFAFLSAWNDSSNPYYNDSDLKKRARISTIADARCVHGYRLRGSAFSITSRLGNSGLAGSGELAAGVFFNNQIDNIEAGDTDALAYNILDQLDATIADIFTSTRNQDCGILPIFVVAPLIWQLKYGNNNLKQVCVDEAKQIMRRDDIGSTNENTPLPEAVSYDGSYCGIQNFEMASAWMMADGDPDWDFLVDSIEKNYKWWQYFVAPTKDINKGIYAYDSDSRTNLGSLQEQYGGAVSKLGNISPIVAKWNLLRGRFKSAGEAASALAEYAELMNTEISNDTDNPTLFEIHGGWKFQIYDMWLEADENISNPNSYVLPAEETSHNVVKVREGEDYIRIDTPAYYASLPTFFPGEFYWRKAQEQHERAREPFETTGGDWLDEPYPMIETSPDKPRRGVDAAEIGGSGISLLYSRDAGRPFITGRNVAPFLTHQIVGITSGDERRWARPSGRTYQIDGNKVVISYTMYGDDNFEDGDVSIVKTMTFGLKSIRIQNQVTRNSGDSIIELYESVPMVSGSNMIGSSSRTAMVRSIENPRSTINGFGDGIFIRGTLQANPFREFYTDHERLTFAKVPITLPAVGQSATTSYTIELPYTEPNEVSFREIEATVTPNRPISSRAGRIRNSPLFFTINNQSFSVQNQGNVQRNSFVPSFERRAVIALSFLLDRTQSFSEIRYTINGDAPTKKSSLYRGPIELDASFSGGEIITLKAKVFDKNSIISGKLLEFRFKINP